MSDDQSKRPVLQRLDLKLLRKTTEADVEAGSFLASVAVDPATMLNLLDRIEAAEGAAVSPATPDLSGLIEIPPIPEMESEQDIDYLKGAPDDWDEDYKSTWKKFQIAARNKSQWRAYALQLRALLAAQPVTQP